MAKMSSHKGGKKHAKHTTHHGGKMHRSSPARSSRGGGRGGKEEAPGFEGDSGIGRGISAPDEQDLT